MALATKHLRATLVGCEPSGAARGRKHSRDVALRRLRRHTCRCSAFGATSVHAPSDLYMLGPRHKFASSLVFAHESAGTPRPKCDRVTLRPSGACKVAIASTYSGHPSAQGYYASLFKSVATFK